MEWNPQILFVPVLGLSIGLMYQGVVIFGAKDPPVQIGGGSIRASVPFYHIWHSIPDFSRDSDQKYMAVTANNEVISINHFDNVPTTIEIPNTKDGWEIILSTTDADRKPRRDVDTTKLCSNTDCDPKKGVDQEKKVYIQSSDRRHWKRKYFGLYWAGLDFADESQDCVTSKGNEPRPCDHLSSVQVLTYYTDPKNPPPPYTCSEQTKCVVCVGQPGEPCERTLFP